MRKFCEQIPDLKNYILAESIVCIELWRISNPDCVSLVKSGYTNEEG
jgi:hypothetical protein